MTKIAVNACNGRMGQALMYAIEHTRGVTLTAPLLRSGHQWVGEPLNRQFPQLKSAQPLIDDLEQVANEVDVVIDFSLPDYSLATVKRCAKLQIPVVIGTTGFSYQQKQQLIELSDQIPMVLAPNMSVGVNLTLKVLELVAKAIGRDSDIEIIESHHRFKKDAPSGTALRMGEAIADGMGKVFSEVAAFDRCGKDAIRREGSIGFSAIRAGNIVGEHTALFAMSGEEVEITHKARDRQTFAQGAVRAAMWAAEQPVGHYDMSDVLGLDALFSNGSF
ncbi:MAG: 4-hydroxy-tetrahydrodipicolinate reductase [Gammaproteobacteria bacterium]|nr:4-hydroxy-tetrahydrodipicolinate reductase [Gammaproteobacteria bacterium]NVK89218.1 4-hydroxy-tetrahydrodipicolinate reductase [Gammaproteobacteria bacterium]